MVANPPQDDISQPRHPDESNLTADAATAQYGICTPVQYPVRSSKSSCFTGSLRRVIVLARRRLDIGRIGSIPA